jgi:hypothetical protein
MNAMETNLLVKADRMSESSLVSLGDWELAYLRLAMLKRVEDAVNESVLDTSEISSSCTNSPRREVGVQSFSAEQPCPSGQGYCEGYCGEGEITLETKG